MSEKRAKFKPSPFCRNVKWMKSGENCMKTGNVFTHIHTRPFSKRAWKV